MFRELAQRQGSNDNSQLFQESVETGSSQLGDLKIGAWETWMIGSSIGSSE